MVNIRLKVGPKGQIVIPKIFRDAYGIKEGGEVILIPTEEGLIIKRKKSPEEILEFLRKIVEKRKAMGIISKLGELAKIDLEDGSNEDISR